MTVISLAEAREKSQTETFVAAWRKYEGARLLMFRAWANYELGALAMDDSRFEHQQTMFDAEDHFIAARKELETVLASQNETLT